MAVYEVTATTTISATPEEVWHVLDDIHHWSHWMPSTKNLHIEPVSHGRPRKGYRFRLRGKVALAELEVTGFGPLERTTAFQLNVPPIKGTNRCLMTPLKNGTYQLKRIDQLVLPGPIVKFLDATQRARFQKLAAEFLVALKHYVVKKEAVVH